MSERSATNTPTAAPGRRPAQMRSAVDVVGRWVLLVFGMAVSTACFGLTIRAHLGLGPLYAVQDGLSERVGISIGTAGMVTGVGLVLLGCALGAWPGPGTVALPFIGGVMIDAMLPHLPEVRGLALRVVVVAAASFGMTLGGALIIGARVGAAALDCVMIGLCRILRRPVGPVRLAMEAAMLASGWLLGGEIGIGTVITAVVIGPGMQFWLRVLRIDLEPASATAPHTAGLG